MKQIDKKERYAAVRAMETMARCVNDEEVFELWLLLGVADGDIDENTADEDIDYYIEDDKFADLMHTFLIIMSRAKKSGGLYADGIVDKEQAQG